MVWDTLVTLLAVMALLVAVVTLVVVLADRQVVIVEPDDDLPAYDWDAAERDFNDGRGPVDHT